MLQRQKTIRGDIFRQFMSINSDRSRGEREEERGEVGGEGRRREEEREEERGER